MHPCGGGLRSLTKMCMGGIFPNRWGTQAPPYKAQMMQKNKRLPVKTGSRLNLRLDFKE